VDLVAIIAGSEVEFRDTSADEMVVPEWQSLWSDRLAGGVLQVDAAGQGPSVFGIQNREMQLRAMRREAPGATHDRNERFVQTHDFECSDDRVLNLTVHGNFSCRTG